MKIKLFLAIGMVIILTLAGLTGCSAAGGAAADVQGVNVNVNSQQGIWVNGEGKVTVTPNIATISLGVTARAAKVADAQAQAAAAMDKIMAALTGNGIDKKDIQTQYFNIYQYTSPIPPDIKIPAQSSTGSAVDAPMPVVPPTPYQEYTGYEVSNMLTVKIRSIDKVGAIIDAVTAAGGDNIRMNGIYFSVDQPGQYNAQARELAMKDAKAKADQIASLSGVTLGKVTYVSESSYSQPYPVSVPMYKAMDSAGGAPSTSISPGQTDIVLNIQVAYAIQ
jgi:uncharacterized protein